MNKLIAVSILLSVLSSCLALECYHCVYYEDNNSTQKECNDEPVPETLLVDCAKLYGPGEYQCVKKTGKTVDDELKYVERNCSFGNAAFDNSCKESDALDSPWGPVEKGFKCFCDTKGCNAASSLSGLVPILGAMLGYTAYLADRT